MHRASAAFFFCCSIATCSSNASAAIRSPAATASVVLTSQRSTATKRCQVVPTRTAWCTHSHSHRPASRPTHGGKNGQPAGSARFFSRVICGDCLTKGTSSAEHGTQQHLQPISPRPAPATSIVGWRTPNIVGCYARLFRQQILATLGLCRQLLHSVLLPHAVEHMPSTIARFHPEPLDTMDSLS